MDYNVLRPRRFVHEHLQQNLSQNRCQVIEVRCMSSPSLSMKCTVILPIWLYAVRMLVQNRRSSPSSSLHISSNLPPRTSLIRSSRNFSEKETFIDEKSRYLPTSTEDSAQIKYELLECASNGEVSRHCQICYISLTWIKVWPCEIYVRKWKIIDCLNFVRFNHWEELIPVNQERTESPVNIDQYI